MHHQPPLPPQIPLQPLAHTQRFTGPEEVLASVYFIDKLALFGYENADWDTRLGEGWLTGSSTIRLLCKTGSDGHLEYVACTSVAACFAQLGYIPSMGRAYVHVEYLGTLYVIP